MKMISKKKALLFSILSGILILIVLGLWQVIILQKAHSSFDNYYVFRGCAQLLEKTDTSGICKIQSGEIVTIVEVGNKWYLQGDGPGVW